MTTTDIARSNARRRAQAEASRHSRAKFYAARVNVDGVLVAPVPDHFHGRMSTYTARGCRCDQCKEAKRQYEAARREAATR